MSVSVSRTAPAWREQRAEGSRSARALGTALGLLLTVPVALLIGGVIAGWFGVR